MTHRTLYLLVTCCVEKTRYDILKTVVANIKYEQASKHFSIEDDLIVFDNGSTFPGTIELLKSNFQKSRIARKEPLIFRSQKNEGFWSAINWVLNSADWVRNYQYIYVIESDHTHFALEKVQDIETFLDRHQDVGGVRGQEFLVSQAHLYDKGRPVDGSRTYAWVHQANPVTKQRITFEPTDVPDFYRSQFLSQLHSVNRMTAFYDVFADLQKLSANGIRFSELDYQLRYYEKYPVFGVLDGGLFHAKLSWFNGSVAGSYIAAPQVESLGYQETRISTIVAPERMTVESI
jgi:hypothetical protein